MDIKIENRDIKLKTNSEAVRISGIEQALQQSELALRIPRGSFVYDRNLGAVGNDFSFTADNAASRLEARLNECLVHTDCYINVQYVEENDNSEVVVGIEVNDGKSMILTEVIVSV